MARWLPILDWLPRYRREDLPGDVVAGTGAAILRAAITAFVGDDAFFPTDAHAVHAVSA